MKLMDGFDSNYRYILVAARRGSPLVIGVGIGEHFIASDVAALVPVTQRFIFLEGGDGAEIDRDRLTIFNADVEVWGRAAQVHALTAVVRRCLRRGV